METGRFFDIVYTAKFKKKTRRAPQHLKKKIDAAFEEIRKEPHHGVNIKQLKGKLSDFYRYRMGDFRLIYKVLDDRVLIIAVDFGPRGDIYK